MNEKDSPVKKRLLAFIDYKNLNNAQFLKKCRLSGSFIQNMRKSIPVDTFDEKIAPIFPELNKAWLLTGDGEMLVSVNAAQVNNNPSINEENKGVPYYDIDFVGGFDLVFNNNQVNPAFYIDFLPFNDADYWVNVSGKSMGPLIAHGDLVALKRVDNWQEFLLEGEIYAVITNNGFRTIKMIGAGKDEEHYTLIPYNKGADYANQSIPKKVITHVFRVKGAIKKFF